MALLSRESMNAQVYECCRLSQQWLMKYLDRDKRSLYRGKGELPEALTSHPEDIVNQRCSLQFLYEACTIHSLPYTRSSEMSE